MATVKKQNAILAVLAVALLAVTAFIWSNSVKDSSRSNADSSSVQEIVEPLLEKVGITDQDDVNFTVRKTAHFLEFMLLGIVSGLLVWNFYRMKKSNFFGWGCFYGLAVADIDEFIQSFSDRTSSVSDVLLDFSGFISGFIIVTLVFVIIIRRKGRRALKAKKNK